MTKRLAEKNPEEPVFKKIQYDQQNNTFQIKETKKYEGSFPAYKQPQEINSYSIDAKRQVWFDNREMVNTTIVEIISIHNSVSLVEILLSSHRKRLELWLRKYDKQRRQQVGTPGYFAGFSHRSRKEKSRFRKTSSRYCNINLEMDRRSKNLTFEIDYVERNHD